MWNGNWGDDERTAELYEFLLHPVKELRLSAHMGYAIPKPRSPPSMLPV